MCLKLVKMLNKNTISMLKILIIQHGPQYRRKNVFSKMGDTKHGCFQRYRTDKRKSFKNFNLILMKLLKIVFSRKMRSNM